MREIVFRGKSGDGWHYGLLTKYGNHKWRVIEEDNNMVTVKTDTIGQYTGLTDKNGAKIFEGDIVRHYCKLPVPGGEIGTDRGTIKWDSEECFFFRTSLDGKDKTISAKCEYEIIGNIYDNPEMVS